MATTAADTAVRTRKPMLLVGMAGLVPAAAAGCGALAAAGGTPAIHAGLLLCIAVSYSAAGLVARWHRPASRIGPLMLLAGVATFLSALSWSGDTAVQTIGQLFDLLPMVLILHLFLAFPAGRLTGRPTRLLVGLGYVAAVGAQPVVMMLGGFGPDHPLRLIDAPDVASAVTA